MTPKSLFIFSVVTAAMVVGAAVSVANRPATTVIPKDRPLVFAGLGDKLNDAFSLEIQTADRKFTVQREGDGWGIAELKGYPASYDKLKTVLVELSELRFLEPKTADPTRFARLDLRDVTVKGAKSTQVTVRDKAGNILAQGLIGKRNDDLFGTGKGGVYMRIAGRDESWLVEGSVKTGDGPADWVSKKILDVSGGSMKRLQIDSPKGGAVVIGRKAPTDKHFTLEDIPPGKHQRGEWETDQMPKALENLTLLDLKRADQVNFGDNAYKGHFTTFDGLVINSEAAKLGKKYWVKLSASTTDGADETTKKRAKSINDRLVGYAYEIKEDTGKKLACEHINMLEGAGIHACT